MVRSAGYQSGSPSEATQTRLRDVSLLRDDMRKYLGKSASDSAIRLGTVTHAEKLKQRVLSLEHLTRELSVLLPRARGTHITLRRCISDLQRQAGAVKASLGVCKKRVDLRSQRPPSELFRDDFDAALQQERRICLTALKDVRAQHLVGRELVEPLEAARKDMQAARLTLHTDRTGYTENLLTTASDLVQSADQYCKDANSLLEDVQGKVQHAGEETSARMRRQITKIYDLRVKIGSEMLETGTTISEAELHLDKTKKQLKMALAMPERNLDCGGDGHNDKLSGKAGVLASLRSKIKSAAYTGPGGRDLKTTFARFDIDRSGELDEEELRIAIRKACKIPPSVITDVDIVALCELLDEDSSGKISIAELVDFLLADVNVEELRDQVRSTQNTLERLKAGQAEILHDFRSKTFVWRITEACSKVTPIKGLELDSPPTKNRQKRPSSAPPCRSARAPPQLETLSTMAETKQGQDAAIATFTSKVRETLRDAINTGQFQAALQEAAATSQEECSSQTLEPEPELFSTPKKKLPVAGGGSRQKAPPGTGTPVAKPLKPEALRQTHSDLYKNLLFT